jgi:hypothetical protein
MQRKIAADRRPHPLQECSITLVTVCLIIFLATPGDFESLLFEKFGREILAISVAHLIE